MTTWYLGVEGRVSSFLLFFIEVMWRLFLRFVRPCYHHKIIPFLFFPPPFFGFLLFFIPCSPLPFFFIPFSFLLTASSFSSLIVSWLFPIFLLLLLLCFLRFELSSCFHFVGFYSFFPGHHTVPFIVLRISRCSSSIPCFSSLSAFVACFSFHFPLHALFRSSFP